MHTLRTAVLIIIGAAVVACGGSKGGPPVAAQSADTAAPADAAPGAPATGGDAAASEEDVDSLCSNWCTAIAVCWEEVNGREYNQGGACVVACSDKSAEERRAFGRCVEQKEQDCPGMVDC